MDLKSMLICSEACAKAASMRKESRGGHTRDDFPETDPEWGKFNVIIRKGSDGEMQVVREPLPVMPAELAVLFEEAH